MRRDLFVGECEKDVGLDIVQHLEDESSIVVNRVKTSVVMLLVDNMGCMG